MSDKITAAGKTTIAPDVLITITRLSALSVAGVSRVERLSGGVDRIFDKPSTEGVKITVENNTVYADVYLIVYKNINIREVCHSVQAQISRAISEMVGMDVGNINIHVEDIDYSEPGDDPNNS
jgi:uncharacterized alkaline shock family protein YloU